MPPQKTCAFRRILAPSLALLLGAALPAGPARAQEPGDPPPAGDAPGAAATGTVLGQVFDAETGQPLEGATVILEPPPPEAGREPRPVVRVTDERGAFRIAGVPPGRYVVRFRKAGYRDSAMTEFEVVAGQVNRADFPLPPRPADTAREILQLEEFVVEASTAEDATVALEMRLESDKLLNVMSGEDFAKFAAGDVAEALERVAGVTVAEGQFAVIRGLEDRYNSTLYNGAPIPSPDPDRQSVQLDLFPSDVVSNLVVAKTFAPDLPSNSAGGAIDILTLEYPSEFVFKWSSSSGFNSNARDRFLEFRGLSAPEPSGSPSGGSGEGGSGEDLDFSFSKGSAIGREADDEEVLESDFSGMLGGRFDFLEREFRFKGVVAREVDFSTLEGFQENLEPAPPETRFGGFEFVNGTLQPVEEIVRSGDLSTGDLGLSAGRFELTESQREEQLTAYGALGFDLDPEGNHRIDGSLFHTEKDEEVVQLREDGFLPGFDYGSLLAKQLAGDEIDANADFDGAATLTSWIARTVRASSSDAASNGPLWFTSFLESESFVRDRDLRVYQLNGDHRIAAFEGLRLRWAWNRAETTQEDRSWGTRFFLEPDDPTEIPTSFPASPEDLGSGSFAANNGIFFSSNEVDETQDFFRVDLEYEAEVTDRLTFTARAGYWDESADREVDSEFLESPSVGGSSQFAVLGEEPADLAQALAVELDGAAAGKLGVRETRNESSRDIEAWSFEAKATVWDRLDLLGGFRVEDIRIVSDNDPFIPGQVALDGTPLIFPTKFLFFDRPDNPATGEVISAPPPGTIFNDEVLNIQVPVDPVTGRVDLTTREQIESLVDGRIDESSFLPSYAVTLRPIEGLRIQGGYSETVARPSFRELGYYVTVESGTDDLIVGNPQLGLSKVESLDARIEYTWGTRGDLFALSLFDKTIDNPIESIVVRNPLNFEGSSSALFRTFFNNPNTADLRGLEVEARKSIDFVGPEVLQYLSVGGNFTYIDAEVDRTEAELSRAQEFFGATPGDEEARFDGLEESRRLFNQPEWIANADITFDHPGWGTRMTLSLFAVSDRLDAAGTAAIGPDGAVRSVTLDRFIDSFHRLDLTFRQAVPLGPGTLTLKGSLENLTDSRREVLFDPEQTVGEFEERSFKVGRDFTFGLTYELRF